MDFKQHCVEISEAAILHVGHVCHLYPDRQLDLAQLPGNGNKLAQLLVKVILEERRARCDQVEVRVLLNVESTCQTQLLTARDVLDDARNVLNAHVAEGIGGGGAGSEDSYRPKNKRLVHDVNPLKVNPFCRSQRYAFGEVLSISTRNWDLFRFARLSSRFRRPSRIHLVTRSRSVSDIRIPRITPVIDSFGI